MLRVEVEKKEKKESKRCVRFVNGGERKEAIDIKREWEKDESREIRETKI